MRVYVAGPYSGGDVALNVRRAILAGEALLARGHSSYIPHLTHFWQLLVPHAYEVWLEQDLVWLEQCEAVLRLSGESLGADREVAIARLRGIPVYDSLVDMARQ